MRLGDMRTVYLITIGRLSWEVEDLAKPFDAECTGSTDCQGLRYKMQPESAKSDYLVVGESSLPLKQVDPFDFGSPRTSKWIYIVSAADPQKRMSYDAKDQANLFPDLTFAGNLQYTNASLAGYVLRLITSVGVVCGAKRSERVLQERANADFVLEAMSNSAKYPRSLISMALAEVADVEEEPDIQVPLHDLPVQKVTLQHHTDEKRVFHVSSEP